MRKMSVPLGIKMNKMVENEMGSICKENTSTIINQSRLFLRSLRRHANKLNAKHYYIKPETLTMHFLVI